MLWTAPELLYKRHTGLNTRKAVQGTQPGDIYGFAIILQEILYRALPYQATGEQTMVTKGAPTFHGLDRDDDGGDRVMTKRLDRYRLPQKDPRDALRHAHRVVHGSNAHGDKPVIGRTSTVVSVVNFVRPTTVATVCRTKLTRRGHDRHACHGEIFEIQSFGRIIPRGK